MLLLGEVRTALLQHAAAVSPEEAERLLWLREGEQVRRATRPLSLVISPDMYTGVDCHLPAGRPQAGRMVRPTRCVGTTVSRVTLTGGRVLQGSTFVRVVKGAVNDRMPSWAKYLSDLGTVQTIGRVDWSEVTRGHLAQELAATSLNLGAISGQLLDTVQTRPQVDRRPPFRAARTTLRWAAVDATVDAKASRVQFTVERDGLRTLAVGVADEQVPHLVALCEDIALHDWLLTTVTEMVDRSRIGEHGRQLPSEAAAVIERLRPVIDHLLHLWMPGMRAHRTLADVWELLEHRSGMSLQWQATVNRVRDQVAVTTVSLLNAFSRAGADAGPMPTIVSRAS